MSIFYDTVTNGPEIVDNSGKEINSSEGLAVAIIGNKKDQKTNESANQPENTIIVSDARIDRAGNEWKRKSLWLRQEHLGKLKVVAHLQETKIEALLDQALEDYLRKNFDNSMAMKKMVKKATGKVPTVKI